MELVIDYRETSLCEALKEIGVQFKQENLLLGDILFRLDNKEIAILERKTLADYAASHLTNRYREQRARLLTARSEGTAIGYLLEGGWRYGSEERVWGAEGRRTVDETMLRTLTYRLQFKYQIPVIHILSTKESAYTLKHLYDIFTENRDYFKETPEEDLATARQATSTTGNFAVRRKDNVKPAASMLMGLHGVSLIKAEAILTVVPTITELCTKTKEEIAVIPAGKQKIGPKLGSDLYMALH